MKNILALALLFLSYSPLSISGQNNGKSCFVIGSAELSQASHTLGSRKNPYTSLAEVQADDSCKVIHVLFSDTALDGGIVLRDGQKLIGKKGKHGKLPIITNTEWNINGGGILLARDNEVKHIHVKDTLSSSIVGYFAFQAFGGEIKLNNVLITGANQAGLYLPDTDDTVALPSVLMLSNEDIDIAIQDSDIGQSNASSLFIFPEAGHAEIIVKNTIVHDQAQLSDNYEYSGGISISAYGDSSINALIKDVRVDNVGSEYFSNSDGLLLLNYGSGAVNGVIDGYHYTNPNKRGHSGTTCGIELGYWGSAGGGSLTAVIKNSIIEDAYYAGIQVVDGYSGGGNTLDVTLIDNEIKRSKFWGIQAFEVVTANSSLNLNIQNNMISDIEGISEYDIKGIGISIAAQGNLDSFEVLLEGNTVQNTDLSLEFLNYGSTIASLQLDAGLGGLGSAGMNRFINSAGDDAFTYGMPVSAKNNWWGSDTGPSSVIEDGFGFIDVEPFLLTDPKQ